MRSPFLILILILFAMPRATPQNDPIKVGVIGLTHTHVHWIFESEKRGEIEITGIVEPNRELARRYAEQHGFSMELVHNSPEELLSGGKPDAVTAFGTIYDHLSVVEFFAPRGIHVMVEKPLATNLEQAKKMAALARKHDIHLLTNYETTWYPTHHKLYDLVVVNDAIGPLRKVVVRDGHKGPKKIGVNEEFLEWLTDPELNGGGALMDFGCYGANLMTWLMQGRRPKSVTALAAQFQAENNPKVEDEAIILLEYEQTLAVIQASWNWPIGRKDVEVYGTVGAVFADNRHDLRIRIPTGYDTFTEKSMKLPERSTPLDDPFSYLKAVIRGKVAPSPHDLSSLENNLIVMEILEAAKKSAATGKRIPLNE